MIELQELLSCWYKKLLKKKGQLVDGLSLTSISSYTLFKGLVANSLVSII